jgi:hypothetical protein
MNRIPAMICTAVVLAFKRWRGRDHRKARPGKALMGGV